MPTSRFPRKRAALTVVVLALVGWYASQMLFPPPKLRIGPETTRISAPWTVDGRLDFVEAMHLQSSVGVTPETNAVVLLDHALGIGEIPVNLRPDYIRRLGIDPTQAGLARAISIQAFIQQEADALPVPQRSQAMIALNDEFKAVSSRPWGAEEFPRMAAWLDANQAAIPLFEQASRRPRFYSPVVSAEGLSEGVSTIQNLRTVARILIASAFAKVAKNDLEGAWDDALTCTRLGHLARQSPATIPSLVAIVIQAQPRRLIEHLVHRQSQSTVQLRVWQAEFEDAAASPALSFAQIMDNAERLLMIDSLLRQLAKTGVDLNSILRKANATCDEMVRAMEIPDFGTRRAALAGIQTALRAEGARATAPVAMISTMVTRSRRGFTRMLGPSLLALLVPSVEQMDIAQTRSQMQRELVSLGLVLAIYRAEQGAYPETLDALVPGELPRIPLDRFTGRALIYQRTDDGFRVYSVGGNQKDDGGVGDQPNADDIAFTVPPVLDQ